MIIYENIDMEPIEEQNYKSQVKRV